MAKTGIEITTTDTVLGAPIDVNTTSMIVYLGKESTGTVTKLRSSADASKVTSTMRATVQKYYQPAPNISLEGKLLWYTEWNMNESADVLASLIRQTTSSSFDERPRQILFILPKGNAYTIVNTGTYIQSITSVQDSLREEGIRFVGIVTRPNINNEILDAATLNNGFISVCPMCDSEDIDSSGVATVNSYSGQARALGLLASVSAGTSIGDGGITPIFRPDVVVNLSSSNTDEVEYVKDMSLSRLNELGEAQQLFTRPRPPRNGLWWNDGATCNDPANALSTLEMARTICAMADDLQSFFVPYINTRVPVTSTGDIQSTYKQVVLDNARAAVVQKYIDNGDISDARISLVAKDNDMIGTRTWEVTLSILPAPTLRWIDGYVFYVKSL